MRIERMNYVPLKCGVALILLNLLNTYSKDIERSPQYSEFSEIVKSIFFVDKSLLINDFLEEINRTPNRNTTPVLISILTGPRFGKTTNNNMVKRFLEIVVDEIGGPVEITNTSNYKLFSESGLAVFKESEIVNKHFGKHPVININCGSLSLVESFDDLLVKYRELLLRTFSEHKYLLRVDSLWTEFNKPQFEIYLNPRNNSELHKYYIFCAFSILSKILHKHFRKPAIVLMDDFNAIENSPAYKTGFEVNRILYFIEEVNNDLLVSNRNVEAALLAGNLYPVNNTLKRDFHKNRVLRTKNDTMLWTYYGLNKQEVKYLLFTYVKEAGDLDEVVETVVANYTSLEKHYRKRENIQPCSVWSVMQYFKVLSGLLSGSFLPY